MTQMGRRARKDSLTPEETKQVMSAILSSGKKQADIVRWCTENGYKASSVTVSLWKSGKNTAPKILENMIKEES